MNKKFLIKFLTSFCILISIFFASLSTDFSIDRNVGQYKASYNSCLYANSFKLNIQSVPYKGGSISIYGQYMGLLTIDCTQYNETKILSKGSQNDYFQIIFESPSECTCASLTFKSLYGKTEKNIFFLPSESGCFVSCDSYQNAYENYMWYCFQNGKISAFEYNCFNRTINEECVLENISSAEIDGGNERDLPSISIYGSLNWNDSDNSTFPLRYTYVELVGSTTTNDQIISYTYTNVNGEYSFSFNPFSIQTSTIINIFIRVYAKGECTEVYKNINSSLRYYYDSSTILTSNDIIMMSFSTTYNINHTFLDNGFNSENKIGNAMQISQAVILGEKFVYAMNNSHPIFTKIEYPNLSGTESDAYSTYLGIYLGNRVYNSWDVILHEYGHKIQEILDLTADVGGPHDINEDCVIGSGFNATDYGIKLAWAEAWPTFFAKLVTTYYSSLLQNLNNNVNYLYQDYSESPAIIYDIETNANNSPTHYYGEGQEGNILQVLYDLLDSNSNELFDSITLSHQTLWNIFKYSSAKSFSEFNSYFVNNFSTYIEEYAKLVSEYGMAPKLTITNSSSISANPIIFWYKSNNGRSNKYDLQICDLDGDTIISKIGLTNEYYALTTNEWETIYLTEYRQFKARVKCYDTNYSQTAFYYSKYCYFDKPLNNVSDNISYTTSTRLVEKPIVLTPGSSATFYTIFQNTGTKIIQTLGNCDTTITIYDSQDNIVDDDDDHGYTNNAFIRISLNSNTQYKIKVEGYDNTIAGKTRLIITEAYSFANSGYQLDNYENIYHIVADNYDLYAYNEQFYTQIITYTPATSGLHTISLSSIYDNYLYVLDPRSGVAMVNGIEYDDDSGNGNNASLSVNLSNYVSYFIVFCQYNPSNPFTNLNEGDDCAISFRKVS